MNFYHFLLIFFPAINKLNYNLTKLHYIILYYYYYYIIIILYIGDCMMVVWLLEANGMVFLVQKTIRYGRMETEQIIKNRFYPKM